MGIAQSVHKLTEAEYLEIERKSEFKSEFFDGEMFAMAGGSPNHRLIASNVLGELRARLKGGRWVVYNSDLRVKIETTGLFTYPDLSVVCGQRLFFDKDSLLNPTLVAEVLSDSTEAYDRGGKFAHYRQIATLQECLLISQKEPRIEQFIRKADGAWEFREATGLGGHLELPSLKVTLDLSEAFANVEFVPTPIRAATPPRRS
ncbi:MAG: Uma2 family endonuclease [Verrucomicrobia bacterium]|nr:Uma2 family endonuclease [Verrucomicrobiota bacterium]